MDTELRGFLHAEPGARLCKMAHTQSRILRFRGGDRERSNQANVTVTSYAIVPLPIIMRLLQLTTRRSALRPYRRDTTELVRRDCSGKAGLLRVEPILSIFLVNIKCSKCVLRDPLTLSVPSSNPPSQKLPLLLLRPPLLRPLPLPRPLLLPRRTSSPPPCSVLSRGWTGRSVVEMDDAARSFFSFGGVCWLFCLRLSAPNSSLRRLAGGLMDSAGPLVAWARADPA